MENNRSGEKIKVLLVDDRMENLFSLESLLTEDGVQIFKASSGVGALALMVDHDFAVALLDVQMPDMDGFELAELMRGTEKTRSVPIIFVTAASPASGFAFKGYELGAVDFLYKPLDPVILKGKVKVFIDLNAQKKMLEVAKEAAETANRLKSSFLANISHEIRTPLGALVGFAELLEDETVSQDQRQQYLQIIKRNGMSLVHLIDDILDLSKIEAGHFEIEEVAFNPSELIDEILALLSQPAEKKNIGLRLHRGGVIPPSLVTDAKRLRQILVNIIGNAIKFTDHGSVDIFMEYVEKASRPQLIFRVEDTGIGLDAFQISRIFKPFVQADSSVTRKFGGTGLGLALSRRLAQLLRGDIAIEKTTPGQGSTFRVSVEARPSAQDAQTSGVAAPEKGTSEKPKTQEKPLQGVRVLVVEDSPDNQFLIQLMLTKRGAEVEFADNGEEGLSKALSNEYDIVLMDLQMPVMDGYMATRKLRENSFQKPIIALSAHAMAEEKEKCIKMGCTDYLSKPIDQLQLVEKVISYSARP